MKKYVALSLLFSACAMQGMDAENADRIADEVGDIAVYAKGTCDAARQIAESMRVLEAKFNELTVYQEHQEGRTLGYRDKKLALLERQTDAQEKQAAAMAQLLVTQQIMVNKMVEAASTMSSGISEFKEVNFNKIDPDLAKLVQGAQTNNNSSKKE